MNESRILCQVCEISWDPFIYATEELDFSSYILATSVVPSSFYIFLTN